MMRTAKALAVAALGIALAMGTVSAATAAPTTSDTEVSASESPRREVLGGVNLWEFCRYLGHADVTNQAPNNVWTWYCVRQDGSFEDINMYAACQWQYTKQWAKPDYRSEQDEYSWFCYLD
jgi:hypothetical protein